MPKLKNKGAIKKRFKKTKNGKIKHKRAGKNHLQSKHSKKHIRRKKRDATLSNADKKKIKRLIH